jgi:hypothetical protein
MRPIAGPAALLAIVGIYLLHRAFGAHEPEPPQSFLDAELALNADATRGSCYALDTVLVADFALRPDLVRSWSTPARDSWQLRVEGVGGAPTEPQHFARIYRFEKHDGRVTLADVESEDSARPQSADAALQELLHGPKARHSTRIANCADPSGPMDRAAPAT